MVMALLLDAWRRRCCTVIVITMTMLTTNMAHQIDNSLLELVGACQQLNSTSRSCVAGCRGCITTPTSQNNETSKHWGGPLKIALGEYIRDVNKQLKPEVMISASIFVTCD